MKNETTTINFSKEQLEKIKNDIILELTDATKKGDSQKQTYYQAQLNLFNRLF